MTEKNCTVNCPKPCCEEDWNIEEMNWAIVNSYRYLYTVEKRLYCSYNALLQKLHYGYDKDCADPQKISKEEAIQRLLKRELYRYKNKKRCLCKEDLQNLFETTERLEKCRIAVNHVQTEEIQDWVRRNPFCASREDWEMYSKALCALWNLEITLSKEECQTDISVEKLVQSECNIALEITKNRNMCDFLISYYIIKELCNIGIKAEVTKQQCKIEWKLLLEKHPHCNIELQTYILCRELGFTYEILNMIIESGMDLQTVDGELFLKGLLQEYRLSSLEFSGLPSNTQDTKHFYDDPKAFVEKYLKEYKVSHIIIDKLLKK